MRQKVYVKRILQYVPVLLMALVTGMVNPGCTTDANPALAGAQQQILTSWGPEARDWDGLSGFTGSSATHIAIIAAGGGMATAVENHLTTYSSRHSTYLSSCTVSGGCLKFWKHDLTSGEETPTVGGAADFASYMVELAHAGCPLCRIDVVEALPVSGTLTADGLKAAVIAAKGITGLAVVVNPYLLSDGASQVTDIGNSFDSSGFALVTPVGDGAGSVVGVPKSAIGVAAASYTAHVGQNPDMNLADGKGGFSASTARQSWEPNIGSSFRNATQTTSGGIGADAEDSNGQVTVSGTSIAAAFEGGKIAATGAIFGAPDVASAPFLRLAGGADGNSNLANPSGNPAYAPGPGFGRLDYHTLMNP